MQSRGVVWGMLITTSLLHAALEYGVTNTNFTISQPSIDPRDDTEYLYNYNRLRVRTDYTQENYFLTFIGDGVNYLGHDYVTSPSFEYITQQRSDTPFKTQSHYYDYYEGALYAKLYRLYGGYADEKNSITLGLQNITMGVGRLWNPTNLFNPRNTYALEPDEVFGVAALSYIRHLGATTDLRVVVSQKKDHSLKYAASLKGFLEYGDVALNLVYSDETVMVGYELEANLAETGIELRSEGAYIDNRALQESPISTAVTEASFFQGIVGGDYGFENGVSLVVEALYSSKAFSYEQVLANLDSEVLPNLVLSQFYVGTGITYTFNLFLEGSLTYIESFNEENSRFITPVLTYSVNDYNTLSLGAMIQSGPRGSEFGMFDNSYYLRYELSF